MQKRIDGGLFVVRRNFKAGGVLFNVGEVIENPMEIKLFRSRLNDRDIIELLPGNDATNQEWLEYMKPRTQDIIDSRVYEFCGVEAPIFTLVEDIIPPIEQVKISEEVKEVKIPEKTVVEKVTEKGIEDPETTVPTASINTPGTTPTPEIAKVVTAASTVKVAATKVIKPLSSTK
jgi:hypothetical protein